MNFRRMRAACFGATLRAQADQNKAYIICRNMMLKWMLAIARGVLR